LIRFSVITVSLNRVNLIGDTIDSVQSQSFQDVEQIFIDGGSTDGTVDVILKKKKPGDVFLSEPDGGIYDAINKGLKLATGNIISILHSDDRYENNFILSRVAEKFSESNVDIVYGDAIFFTEKSGEKVVRRYHSGALTLKRLEWGWMPAHTAMFIKREIYQVNGDYKLGYRIASDYEFLCRLLSTSKINYRYIPEVLVRMAIGGISTSGYKNTFLLNREVFRACHENGLKTNFIKLLSKYPSKFMGLLIK
jgi:glycosyltransferase involved in cell wall biosynthesis